MTASRNNMQHRISSIVMIIFFVLNILLTIIWAVNTDPEANSSFFIIFTFILYFISITIAIQFLLFRDFAYFFYVLYILANIFYFSTMFSARTGVSINFPSWYPEVVRRSTVPLLAITYMLYTLFALKFINVQKISNKLYKWLMWLVKYYAFTFIVGLLMAFFTKGPIDDGNLRTIVISSYIPVGIVAILLIYFKITSTIVRVFVLGSFCFFTGSLLGFLFSFGTLDYPTTHPPFNNWITYTQLGILLEIILFTSSFSYRSKLLMIEDRQIRDELLRETIDNKEKEQRLQTIRNEIANNLHDDIGASLSNINILNELAQRNTEEPEKVKAYLVKAGEDIQRISEDLNDIVWNINPRYDDIKNLFIRMRHYALEMLEAKDIKHSLYFPMPEDHVKLSMDKRRDLYLIFKESINNLCKYSQAKTAIVSIRILELDIELNIIDDGIGYDMDTVRKGNGLLNMAARSATCGGSINVVAKPNEGTSILFLMPLT